ncbi:Cation efflux system protein CzcA [Nymphon striatum]|nr:Cation efflux system protein CzcA [Nymphon striatum]
MGSEFVPSLNEGDIALHALRIPGTSLTQAVKMQKELEHTIQSFPQVARVFAKMGTAEIASDPMPPNVADTFIMLKPKSEWPDPSLSKAALTTQIQQAISTVPGNNYELSKTSGLPILTINIDRQKIARLGINVSQVQDVVAMAMNGQVMGSVFQGDRRFDIVVRLTERLRTDMESVKRLPIKIGSDNGEPVYVQLGEVATINIAPGPNQFSRENGKRNVVVTANVRDRDIGSYVAEAQQRIQQEVKIQVTGLIGAALLNNSNPQANAYKLYSRSVNGDGDHKTSKHHAY